MRTVTRLILSVLMGTLAFFVTPFIIAHSMPSGSVLGIIFYIAPIIVSALTFKLLS